MELESLVKGQEREEEVHRRAEDRGGRKAYAGNVGGEWSRGLESSTGRNTRKYTATSHKNRQYARALETKPAGGTLLCLTESKGISHNTIDTAILTESGSALR